jgi:hypothetical protein
VSGQVMHAMGGWELPRSCLSDEQQRGTTGPPVALGPAVALGPPVAVGPPVVLGEGGEGRFFWYVERHGLGKARCLACTRACTLHNCVCLRLVVVTSARVLAGQPAARYKVWHHVLRWIRCRMPGTTITSVATDQ